MPVDIGNIIDMTPRLREKGKGRGLDKRQIESSMRKSLKCFGLNAGVTENIIQRADASGRLLQEWHRLDKYSQIRDRKSKEKEREGSGKKDDAELKAQAILVERLFGLKPFVQRRRVQIGLKEMLESLNSEERIKTAGVIYDMIMHKQYGTKGGQPYLLKHQAERKARIISSLAESPERMAAEIKRLVIYSAHESRLKG